LFLGWVTRFEAAILDTQTQDIVVLDVEVYQLLAFFQKFEGSVSGIVSALCHRIQDEIRDLTHRGSFGPPLRIADKNSLEVSSSYRAIFRRRALVEWHAVGFETSVIGDDSPVLLFARLLEVNLEAVSFLVRKLGAPLD